MLTIQNVVQSAHTRATRRSWPGWLAQILKFCLVGALNTLLDAGLYLALTRWLGLGQLPALAKGLSYGAGIVNSFYWNKTWTFGSESGKLTPFVLTNLIALGINAGVMYVCLNELYLHEALGLVLATLSSFGWNFGVSKWLIFK